MAGTEIAFRDIGETTTEKVSSAHPLPVAVPRDISTVNEGRLVRVAPFIIPDIAAADALDANDAMGGVFSIAVPKAGAIVNAVFYDVDDEGIAKEVWVFRENPSLGAPASDAAFALTDANLLNVVGVLYFSTFRDATNGQVSQADGLPFWYAAPRGRLWFQVKTLGADNIAANAMPRLALTIERYASE